MHLFFEKYKKIVLYISISCFSFYIYTYFPSLKIIAGYGIGWSLGHIVFPFFILLKKIVLKKTEKIFFIHVLPQKYKKIFSYFIYIFFYILSCFILLKTNKIYDIEQADIIWRLLDIFANFGIFFSLYFIFLANEQSLEKKFSEEAVQLTFLLVIIVVYLGTVSFLADFC